MESNVNEVSGFGDLTNLKAEKLQELETILTSILALPIARETYAQIIDGFPTRNPRSREIWSARSSPLSDSTISQDSRPSDRAVQLYEEIRVAFAPQGLKVSLKVCTHSLFS